MDKENKSEESPPTQEDVDVYNYICPSLSNCGDESSCPYKYHHSVPYQWRLVDNDGNCNDPISILSLESGRLLEKQFCNPDLVMGEMGMIGMLVNFKDMTSLEDGVPPIKIKRISTPPSIISLKQLNTSNWIWYWQCDDPNLTWGEIKYYCLNSGDDEELTGGQMETLERLYAKQQQLLKTPELFPTVEGSILKQRLVLIGKKDQYRVILNFNTMTMLLNGNEVEVRRRPDTFNKFVEWSYLDNDSAIGLHWVTFGDLNAEGDTRYPITSEDLEAHHQNILDVSSAVFVKQGYSIDLTNRETKMVDDTSGKVIKVRRDVFQGNQLIPRLETYPRYWDPMPKSRIYVTFMVPKDSAEFKDVQKLIPDTHSLVHLRRIQNPAAYNSYMETKAVLEKAFPNLNEETLFHGTKDVSIKLICETNFDPRLAGTVNGMMYGAGTYFGKTVITSLRYCRSRPPHIRIFVCKVLVGATAQGSKDKSPNDKRITLVNSMQSPSIFVNRMPHSFRPEYIAELTGPREI